MYFATCVLNYLDRKDKCKYLIFFNIVNVSEVEIVDIIIDNNKVFSREIHVLYMVYALKYTIYILYIVFLK